MAGERYKGDKWLGEIGNEGIIQTEGQLGGGRETGNNRKVHTEKNRGLQTHTERERHRESNC